MVFLSLFFIRKTPQCLYGENLKERAKGRLLLAFYFPPYIHLFTIYSSNSHSLPSKHSFSTKNLKFLFEIFIQEYNMF